MAVEKEILDNGIILYKNKIEDANTIGVSVAVNIGSIYEPKEFRGISHLLEHMMFKSNKKYKSYQINMGLELNGGIANAFTSTFLTAYFVETIPEGFEKVMDILFSMFENDKYDEKEFENEKKVVLSEIERYENNPESKLHILIPRSIFGDSDYGDPVEGYRETVSNISLKDLEEFKAKYYTPKNMFILIEGNFNNKHIEILKKYFEKLDGEYTKLKNPIISKGRDIIEHMDTKNQIYFSLNYELEKDFYLKALGFSNIVSGGISSIVFQTIREKYGIGYHVEFSISEIYPDRLIMSLIIPGFEIEKEKILDEAINELFYKLKNEDLKEYIDGRKKRTKLIYESKKKSIFWRIKKDIIYIYLFGNTLEYIEDYIMKIEDLDIKDVVSKLKEGRKVVIYPEVTP